MDNNFNRSFIRPYFGGKSAKLPIILLIVGIALCFTGVLLPLGIILAIVAIVLDVKNRFFSDFSHEEDVDKAMAYDFEKCKERSLEKLGLVKEQVNLIEPIFVSGPADNVPSTATGQILSEQMSSNIVKKVFNKKNVKKQLADNSDDPMFFIKFGSDDKLRYTLLQNTAYYFGEEQLYIYYENVDIATGLVYSSGTLEYFYKDIEGLTTYQTNTKQFNVKKKKFERIIREYFTINLAGTSYTASFKTYNEKQSAEKVVDNQFTSMRNLIRDKKMA